MTYSFDSHGWLSLAEIPGRTTDIEPPVHGQSPVVGQSWPNFIGPQQGWTLTPYTDPPIPDPKPAQREAIQDQLDKIDKQTNKPRTLREIQLGNQATMTWLAQQDALAVTLRAQLAALG